MFKTDVFMRGQSAHKHQLLIQLASVWELNNQLGVQGSERQFKDDGRNDDCRFRDSAAIAHSAED